VGASLIEATRTESFLEDVDQTSVWESAYEPVIEKSESLPEKEKGAGAIVCLLGLVLLVVSARGGSKKIFESGLLYQKQKHVKADRLADRIDYVEKEGAKLESPYKINEDRSLLDLPLDDAEPTPTMKISPPKDAPVEVPSPATGTSEPAAAKKFTSPPGGALNLMITSSALKNALKPSSVDPSPGKADEPVKSKTFKCSSCDATFSLKTDKSEIICPGCGTKYELPK